MKDIFELLKHEGHDIEIIKHNGEHLLGCKQCGKTLLTEQYLKENTKECISLFKTLKNENSSLCEYAMLFLNEMLELTNTLCMFIKRAVSLELNDLESKDYLNKIDRICSDFNIKDVLKYAYNELRNINAYDELLCSLYSSDEVKEIYLKAKAQIVTFLNKNLDGYSVYHGDDTKTYGCKEYNLNDSSLKEYLFFTINNSLAKELEEENPTPTDVYVFKDIHDFYDISPDWSDEEECSYKFNEFIYRIENDLYDFRNIEGGEIILLKDAISILSDYDNVDRYVVPARRYLEKYLTNKEEK